MVRGGRGFGVLSFGSKFATGLVVAGPLLAGACLAQGVGVRTVSAHAGGVKKAGAGSDAAGAGGSGARDLVLIDAMESELHRAMGSLGAAITPVAATVGSGTASKPDDGGRSGSGAEQPKPYFLSYAVADSESVNITAQFGAVTQSSSSHARVADVQVRLGSPALDNTHGTHRTSALTTLPLPLTDDREAIERSLWYATNRGYGKALDALEKVKTEQQVRAKEEDQSADFSAEKAQTEVMPAEPPLTLDKAMWEDRLREITAVFRSHEQITYDMAILQASHETDYFVSSEGAKVAAPNQVARLIVVARTRAADGMDLFRAETFEADATGHLPVQKAVLEKVEAMAKNLDELRVAPITEPFDGPAILSGRASAVFFPRGAGAPAGGAAAARG